MSTDDDGPKNSITLIENYIDKRKSNLPQCINPNQTPNIPFEFPPGHRIRIEKFITYIKNRCGVGHKVGKTEKGITKKRKTETETDEDSSNVDIPSVKNEIRRKIISWSKNNCTQMLKENDNFTIQVTRSTLNPLKLTVLIRCQCGTSLTLQQKPTGSKPWQISNWTKHYKQCQHGNKPTTSKQDTIQSFFLPNTSINATPSATPTSLQSRITTDTLSHPIPPFSDTSATILYPPYPFPVSHNMPRLSFSPYSNTPSSTPTQMTFELASNTDHSLIVPLQSVKDHPSFLPSSDTSSEPSSHPNDLSNNSSSNSPTQQDFH